MSDGHAHAIPTEGPQWPLGVASGLIGALFAGELVAAAFSGSLALLADAGHLLTDVAALLGSLVAARLARRPAAGPWTYGLRRAEILSAAANGVTLVAVAAVVAVEAVRRLVTPPAVHGGLVLAVALVGAVVNVAATVVLGHADRTSLNVRGALAHVATDLFAFTGTAIAGLVIMLTSWTRADAVASLVIAGLMVRAAWGLLRDAGRILLEAVPAGIAIEEVRAHIVDIDHVIGVHDLHAWTVTSALPTLSAHVVVEDHCFTSGHAPAVLDSLQQCLGAHFDIEHSTFQLEPASHAAHESGGHP